MWDFTICMCKIRFIIFSGVPGQIPMKELSISINVFILMDSLWINVCKSRFDLGIFEKRKHYKNITKETWQHVGRKLLLPSFFHFSLLYHLAWWWIACLSHFAALSSFSDWREVMHNEETIPLAWYTSGYAMLFSLARNGSMSVRNDSPDCAYSLTSLTG